MEPTVLQRVVPPLWELERQGAVVPPWQRPERQAAVVLPWERPERRGEVVPPWRGAELPKPFPYWKILLARAQRAVLDPTLSSSVLKMQTLTGRSPEQAATRQPSFHFSERALPPAPGLLGAKTMAGSTAKIL
jgi:hypothetical protein